MPMSINSNVGTRNIMFVSVFAFVPAALMSIYIRFLSLPMLTKKRFSKTTIRNTKI